MEPEAAAARGAQEVVTRLPSSVRALRSSLLGYVERSTSAVVAVQRACGVYPGLGATNTFIHSVAVFSAALGNEITFITLLPTLFWELDLEVSRRAIWLWVSSYFVVHVIKDTLCLPRPPAFRPCEAHSGRLESAAAAVRKVKTGAKGSNSRAHYDAILSEVDACSACAHGVVKLESLYAWEFGFPSSHTHNAFSMPLLIAALTWPRFEGPHVLLAALAAFWVVCGTLCRAYLGVHSIPDIIGGAVWGLFMLAVHLAVGSSIDAAILQTPPLVTAVVGFAAMAIAMALYPKPRFPAWVATPGDTTIICAVTVGVATAASLGAHAHIAAAGRVISVADSPVGVGFAVLRVLLGFAFLLTVRAVGKSLCATVLPRIMPLRWADAEDGSVRLPGQVTDAAAAKTEPAGSPRGEDPISAPLSSPRSDNSTAASSGIAQSGSGAGLRSRSSAAVSAEVAEPSDSPAGDPASSPRSSNSGFGSSSAKPVDGTTAGSSAKLVVIPPQKNYWVELPTKMVVYSSVGFSAVYIVPRLFQALGLKQYGL